MCFLFRRWSKINIMCLSKGDLKVRPDLLSTGFLVVHIFHNIQYLYTHINIYTYKHCYLGCSLALSSFFYTPSCQCQVRNPLMFQPKPFRKRGAYAPLRGKLAAGPSGASLKDRSDMSIIIIISSSSMIVTTFFVHSIFQSMYDIGSRKTDLSFYIQYWGWWWWRWWLWCDDGDDDDDDDDDDDTQWPRSVILTTDQ